MLRRLPLQKTLSAFLLSFILLSQVSAQTLPFAAPPALTTATTPPPPAVTIAPPTTTAGLVGAVAGAAIAGAILPTPPAAQKASNVIGPDLTKLYLCKRDITQDANMCKQYVTFFCSGYCTHDGCSDCSNRGVCLDVCGETGATMMACVESNKNCASPDQIFSNFLTGDAKTAITQYASLPGQPQYLPPQQPMASPYGAPGMMPGGMQGGMMPGMGMGGMGMMPGMGMGGMGMMPGMGMGMPGMMPGMGMGMGGAGGTAGALGALGGMAAMSMMSRPATPPPQ